MTRCSCSTFDSTGSISGKASTSMQAESLKRGHVAQLVERLNRTEEVRDLKPPGSTREP